MRSSCLCGLWGPYCGPARSLERSLPRSLAGPKRRSTAGLNNLHPRSIRIQNLKLYSLELPRGLRLLNVCFNRDDRLAVWQSGRTHCFKTWATSKIMDSRALLRTDMVFYIESLVWAPQWSSCRIDVLFGLTKKIDYLVIWVLGGPGYLQLGYSSTYKPIMTWLTLLRGLINGIWLQLWSELYVPWTSKSLRIYQLLTCLISTPKGTPKPL